MIRSYALAAIRSISRNKLSWSLDLVGLTTALAISVLIALYVVDELSYDRFIPDASNVYRISSDSLRNNVPLSTSQKQLAGLLLLDYREVLSATRLLADNRGVRHGEVEANEKLYWTDPNLFSTLNLPTVAGDSQQAFASPDAAVVTERIARKYFGRTSVVGETLEIDHAYRVVIRAVLRDLPSNSHLDTEILVSGDAAFSGLRALDINAPGDFFAPVHTYFRLRAGADVEKLRREMPGFIDRHWPGRPGAPASSRIGLTILPVQDIHLGSKGLFAMKPASEKTTVLSLALVAVLIVVAACINLVNLMIARSLRRGVEVGVRKCFGAGRRDLIAQFIGESICIVGVAFLCAMALAELALPAFTAFVGHELAFRWWAQPWLVAAAVLGVAVLATLASLYPAVILASFRASTVIRAGKAERAGSNPVRRVLVVVQFAILIGLLVATGTIQAQMRYAMTQATGMGEKPIVLVRTKCDGVFPQAVRELPGVRAAACSASAPTNFDRRGTSATRAGVPDSIQIDVSGVDFDFFGLYGLEPMAGRVFAREHAADGLVLNESAVRKLGFESAADAVGQAVKLWHVKDPKPATIIGVVPDFRVESVREPVGATAFYIDPRDFNLLSIALDTRDLSAMLRDIDRLWSQHSGSGRPIDRLFVQDYVSDIYSQMRLQGALFAVLSVVAAVIACTGLFSFAVLTSQRRTREIGLRKTFGADVWDIVSLLIWQFLKPVLWANVVAWPVTILLLQRWLDGFAYHIELQWGLFFASSFSTLAIALAVVAGHTRFTARAKPARALRYE